MIMVTERAIAAGIASIPGAWTDALEDGWFCIQMFAQAGVQQVDDRGAFWYPIDTKGKRVFPGEGISIAIVGENAHATHGLEMSVQLRVLSQVRGTR